ncbi:hypothetical protein CG775_15260 [Paenibacillus polymyxa]|nr:hypothetical protein CG775_15260 [Paenibacillus polymyxa]
MMPIPPQLYYKPFYLRILQKSINRSALLIYRKKSILCDGMDEEAAIPVYDEMSNLLTFDIHEWPVPGKNSSSDFLSLPRDRLSASQLPVYSNADQFYLVQQQKKDVSSLYWKRPLVPI